MNKKVITRASDHAHIIAEIFLPVEDTVEAFFDDNTIIHLFL